MLLRLPNSSARLAAVFFAFTLTATLAYFSIRNARAVYYVNLGTRLGYESAVRLERDNPNNWYLLGRYWQYTLDEADPRRAIQNYLRSLSLNPRSPEAWLDLATVYESVDDYPNARAAFLQAKRAYPISAAVSWRFGNFLLRQAEIPQAFAEIHRAVYADPKRSTEAFSRCWRVVPDVNKILDNVLPPDRDAYLAVIRELGADGQLAAALTVWRRLVSLHPSLQASDAIYLSDVLIQKLRVSDARSVWNDALRLSNAPQHLDPPSSVLWDGGFETNVQGGGFAWFFALPSGGVQTSLDFRQKHSGNSSLRIIFDGRHNVDFEPACNNAEVRSGTNYHLSAWVRTQTLTTNQGVRLRLSWYSDSGQPGALETSDVQGTQPWTLLEMPWTSGKDVHYARVCIARKASTKLDSQIHGSAWIDDVALIPDTGNSRP